MIRWLHKIFNGDLFVCEDIVKDAQLYNNFLSDVKCRAVLECQKSQRNTADCNIVLVNEISRQDARRLTIASQLSAVSSCKLN